MFVQISELIFSYEVGYFIPNSMNSKSKYVPQLSRYVSFKPSEFICVSMLKFTVTVKMSSMIQNLEFWA